MLKILADESWAGSFTTPLPCRQIKTKHSKCAVRFGSRQQYVRAWNYHLVLQMELLVIQMYRVVVLALCQQLIKWTYTVSGNRGALAAETIAGELNELSQQMAEETFQLKAFSMPTQDLFVGG